MRSPIDGVDVVTRQTDAQAEARALLTPSLDVSSLDVLDESTEPESTPPTSERGEHVRRRKRVPRAWKAANEGRVEDLRVALVERSTGLATAGPTARLGGSSSHHGPGPTRTLNWCNGEGVTPLHAACFHGHADCVQLLLDAHAALDPRQKGGATPLIVATRQGHAPCVARLLGAGADITRRNETGTALDNARAASARVIASGGGGADSGGGLHARLAECLSILEVAGQRQEEEQAVLLQQRQREAADLAHAADALLQGPNLVRAALDRPGPQPSAPRRSLSMAWRERDAPALEAAARDVAARDELLHASCMAIAAHGFEAGHVSPPALERWVGSAAGRERLAQLAEEIPSLAEAGTGRELALVLRVLQMHLREAAQPAAGGALGADQLVPLLEPLVVAASPRDAWSLHARMQTISAQAPRTLHAIAALAYCGYSHDGRTHCGSTHGGRPLTLGRSSSRSRTSPRRSTGGRRPGGGSRRRHWRAGARRIARPSSGTPSAASRRPSCSAPPSSPRCAPSYHGRPTCYGREPCLPCPHLLWLHVPRLCSLGARRAAANCLRGLPHTPRRGGGRGVGQARAERRRVRKRGEETRRRVLPEPGGATRHPRLPSVRQPVRPRARRHA